MFLRKRLLAGLLLSSFLLSLFPSLSFANEDETYFIITAYYSPLPGQSKYFNGSYQREIYVNGEGTHGASGEAVFEWMLAAPKKYPFGTKIHFEGYGVAEVQDRGWAIVSAGSRWNNYDRIDIWMGYGDVWRERAVQWGRQTVKWKIVSSETENTLKFDNQSSVNFLSLRVSPESESNEIIRLQELFVKAGLYAGEIDGKYESIQGELIDFQLTNNIISSENEEFAGYFWPQTIEALSKILAIPKTTLTEENLWVFYNSESEELTDIQKMLLSYGDLQVGPESSVSDIQKLQELLRDLWEYSWEIDGIYGSVSQVLILLQIELGLVENEKDWGAGYFGNKTRSALWEYYDASTEAIKKNKDESERTEEIESSYTLSVSEKKAITEAIVIIKQRLKTEELQWWATIEKSLQALSQQIEEIAPLVHNQEILAKILFIQSEIR